MTSTETHIPTVTTRDLGTVDLAGTTYTATELLFSSYTDRITGETRPESHDVHLTGPRGAVYLLRPFLGADTGLRQVISLGSGAPLRRKGNEVRVIRIGDVIEVAR